MQPFSKGFKELIRYIIIVFVLWLTYTLSIEALRLEDAGKLTMQFSSVVASSYALATLVLKFIFETTVSHPHEGSGHGE